MEKYEIIFLFGNIILSRKVSRGFLDGGAWGRDNEQEGLGQPEPGLKTSLESD
ncbi:MAG: hypothetical protein JRJ78_12740 [Deltaproteobacteria bacterium]|nr:hypothetical protein [Deltaproteobacteria bacterium]